MPQTPRWIPIPHVVDDRGLIGVVEEIHLPFEIRRVFFMSRVPAGIERGGHAHPHTDQLAIAVGGELKIETFDGSNRRLFQLSDETQGLYLPRMTWTRLFDFWPTATVIVLASTTYAPSDVIRNENDYRAALMARAEERR